MSTPPDTSTAGAPSPAATPPPLKVRHTRVSGAWVAVVCFVLVLIALVIFIAQNLQHVKVSFLVFVGTPPLALAMLCAAILGALLVAIPGVGRVFQLRRVARRHRQADLQAAQAAQAGPAAAGPAASAAPGGPLATPGSDPGS